MIAAIEWLKNNWKGLGYPLAALFCLLWLTKKPEQLTNPAPLVVNQAQAMTQTAKASVTVKLVYRDRLIEVPGETKALPCPDVEIQADSGSSGEHWQSQAVTQTANLTPSLPLNAVFLGAGYLAGPILVGGYRRQRLGVQVQGWSDKVGGTVTVDALAW
jgi:hypothetical protein